MQTSSDHAIFYHGKIMAPFLLIVTGPPGCGKTHFSARVKNYFPAITVLSYDTIKERYFDEYGFDNMEEKQRVNDMSIAAFYTLLEDAMRAKKNILIEYPFNKIHEQKLCDIVSSLGYKAVTIRLTGDWRALYERAVHRDVHEPRNPGHLLRVYHKERPVKPEDVIPEPDFESFVEACERKNYRIEIGDVFTVDVTDYNAVDYASLFAEVEKKVTEEA